MVESCEEYFCTIRHIGYSHVPRLTNHIFNNHGPSLQDLRGWQIFKCYFRDKESPNEITLEVPMCSLPDDHINDLLEIVVDGSAYLKQ